MPLPACTALGKRGIYVIILCRQWFCASMCLWLTSQRGRGIMACVVIGLPLLTVLFYRNVQLIYIFAYVFVPVLDCTCRSLLRRRSSFPAVLICFHLFTTIWREATWPLLCLYWGCDFSTLSGQTLLNKDRQCCESWRDAELGVYAVCAVSDTTDEDRWVDLLCCSPHCDTAESCLTNDALTTFSLGSDCYDDWCRPSPTVLRRQQSVPSVSSTTPCTNVLTACC